MQCSKCGGQNPEDAFFCGTCGVQLRSSFQGSGPVGLHSAEALDSTDEFDARLDPEAGSPAADANPFTEAEPTARRVFSEQRESAAMSPPAPPPPVSTAPLSTPPGWPVNAPGAGLAPPPPPPPPQAPPGMPRQAAPPTGYGPTPPGYQPGGYGLPMPPDGNTSGMGEGYPVPPEASGWTFAGFVPFGLFSFLNGNSTWGLIGLLLSFFGFYIVYWIYVGITGRENAWRNRRFSSIQEYVDTMRVWSNWGIGLILLGVVFVVLYFVLVFAIIFAGVAGST